MEFTIEVTQEDIDSGERLSSTDCIVGRALNRVYPGSTIGVFSCTINQRHYRVPDELASYICEWCNSTGEIKPRKFKLKAENGKRQLLLVP